MSPIDPNAAEPLVPYPLAMVVCDAIYVDPESEKRSLTGCFTQIVTASFPAVLPYMAVYAAVSELVGDQRLILQLIDLAEAGEPLHREEVEVERHDPLDVVEIDFRLRDIVFPAPGKYRLQLFAGDAPLQERILTVITIPTELSS